MTLSPADQVWLHDTGVAPDPGTPPTSSGCLALLALLLLVNVVTAGLIGWLAWHWAVAR